MDIIIPSKMSKGYKELIYKYLFVGGFVVLGMICLSVDIKTANAQAGGGSSDVVSCACNAQKCCCGQPAKYGGPTMTCQ